MKVIEKLDIKIKELLLVAPAIEPKFGPDSKRIFWDNFDFNYDYKSISERVEKVSILSDNTEADYREEYLTYLADQLNCPLYKVDGAKKHFIAETEPAILELLKPSIKVFTTRADTIFSAAFVVLAPEHELVGK